MIKVAPSILAADVLNMGRDVQRMIDAGCDWLHVDIMDAHFVPNLSYGPALTEALHRGFDIPLDVHLMMDNPEKYIDVFCDAGASWLTIHAEIPGNVAEILRRIREKGVKAGLSVKPGTPIEAIADLLPLTDMVLIMTVEPGFGGQSFMADMMPKLKKLRTMLDEVNPGCVLQVDGGVDEKTCSVCKENGAEVLVAGSAYFKAADRAAFVKKIQE